MVFEVNQRGEYFDQERGLTVNTLGGGPGGFSLREIRGDGWFIRFNYVTEYPPVGDSIKLTKLKTSDSFYGTREEAIMLVTEYLDSWRRHPANMKGRDEPKQIVT